MSSDTRRPVPTESAAEAPGRGAHLPNIASQGGRAVVQKYGSEYMSQIGRRGAKSVAEKYGPGFYAEIGARNKGVKKRRRPPAREGTAGAAAAEE